MSHFNQLVRGTYVTIIFFLLTVFSGTRMDAMEAQANPTVLLHRTATVQGKTLHYTTETGFLPLLDPNGTVRARIFSMTYRLEQPEGAPTRPLIFAWNGGPGSNSGQIHLGMMGPKIAADLGRYASFSDKIQFVDNPFTWLQFADLVFVDPVNTGYSFATSAEYQKSFLSSSGDALSIAEFIRVYLEAHDMQHVAILLAGESYGTFRAAGVSYALAQHGILVKGLLLFSCVLKFGDQDSVLNSVAILPSYTAAAWAQHKLAATYQGSLQEALAASRTFAGSSYLHLLVAGDAVSPDERDQVARQLENFTGVPASVWKSHDFRLSPDEFAKEASADKTKYIAHYDTRLLGTAHLGAPYDVATDPSLSANGINVGIVQYIRSELQFRTEAFYNGAFGGRWPEPYSMRGIWNSWDNQVDQGGDDRTKDLKAAMELNPHMRIFVASGYFDLSTPFGVTQSTFDHMGLSPDQRNHLQLVNYKGGHMMYFDHEVRPRLYQDVSDFVATAIGDSPSK